MARYVKMDGGMEILCILYLVRTYGALVACTCRYGAMSSHIFIVPLSSAGGRLCTEVRAWPDLCHSAVCNCTKYLPSALALRSSHCICSICLDCIADPIRVSGLHLEKQFVFAACTWLSWFVVDGRSCMALQEWRAHGTRDPAGTWIRTVHEVHHQGASVR